MSTQLAANTPLVSILLPNLNYRQYLEARFESILAQSYVNWELIVVDSYSDDGSWELIQDYAAQDDRIRTTQAPREGIYAGLNICLELAKGEFIYIATSDDTMEPDCLTEMVSALQRHTDCGICHCCLRVIGKMGNTLSGKWEWRRFPVAKYFGTLLDVSHIRRAPHDGILHCATYTVYTSLTQILIRRSVFQEIGAFKIDIGEGADFEWGMRASLTTDIVHIPQELATWRVHDEQITYNAPNALESEKSHASLARMVKSAHASLLDRDPALYDKLPINRLKFPYERLQVDYGFWERSGRISKVFYLIRMLFVNAKAVISFLIDTYLCKKDFDIDKYIQDFMSDCGYEDCIVREPLSNGSTGEKPKQQI